MNYTLDIGPWNQVFAVPAALVDRHLKLAGKEQLQAILWILRHAGESFTSEELASALGITNDAALDALEYWQDLGLLSGRGGDLRPLPQAALNDPIEKQPEAPVSKPEKPIKKRRLEKPDMAYLVKRREESDSIRYLLQEAEATLGLLSPAMNSVLLASVDDYGLPVEVVTMLLHYAKEIGKTSTSYIDSVARDWAQSGIFTLEAAEEKLRELSEMRLAWGKVSAAAGLQKRSPSKKEEESAYRWVKEWGFTPEMIAAAYERCVDHTGKFSAAYINKVLERWHGLGLKNTAEVEAAEAKQSDGNKKHKSYDIDELERMSFFDVPEDL